MALVDQVDPVEVEDQEIDEAQEIEVKIMAAIHPEETHKKFLKVQNCLSQISIQRYF